MELVVQLGWAPGHMAAVEGSLEVDNLDLAVGSLDPEAGIHILLEAHLAVGSPGLEMVVGLEAGHPVHFVRSSHRKVRGHQERHPLEHHHMIVGEQLEVYLAEYLQELFWSYMSHFTALLPAGFLSSSSSNSFIFFLRKSIVSSY